jgi:hypothetical protein
MSAIDMGNRDYDFKMGQYFSRGWDLFKAKALQFIGFLVLIVVVLGIISFILPYPLGSGNLDDGQTGGNIVSNILSALLFPGFYIVAFQIARNRATSFSDFFKGFNRALPILLLSIVSSILIGLGFILLIIPGIYLVVSYALSMPLLLDKNLDFWPAMETSRKVVGKKWWSFFLFGIALFFLNLAGAILLGLGLLVTVPWSFCSITAAYEDIVGLNSVADAV